MDPFLLLLIGIAVVLICILVFRLHPVIALLLAAISVGLLTTENNLLLFADIKGYSAKEASVLMTKGIGSRIAEAFGVTAGKIGILIAMASIIGTCLLRSGGADRIVRSLLKVFGEKRIPVALLSSGFTLAIPVFFDTVFYLLVPIIKAMTLRTKKNYLLYIIVIVAGAQMAHSLVPPTPGPLYVAAEMGVDLGVMILGGIVVGSVTVTVGYLYAIWANRRWTVPLRETGDVSISELHELIEKDDKELPSIGLALLPIILPIVFIAGNTLVQASLEGESFLSQLFKVIGNSNMALTISALIALSMLATYERDRSKLKEYVTNSLQSAGIIILITGMGGAFGSMLQQTGIGVRLGDLADTYHIALIPLAFFITALMRGAQGSSTVAMITSIGIVGGLATPDALQFHPVYLALAIGCGGKPFQWMNDSGFWVVCKMTGMTEGETIRASSAVLTIMGFVGLVVVMLGARLLPLI